MRLLTEKSFLKLFSDEFERTLMKSAYARFNDLNDPLRCNLFSLLARELIRIFLVRIAPDEDIVLADWFDPKNNDGKPTRADRFRYALTGKIIDTVVDNHGSLDVSSQCKELVAIVDRLSKYAHISPETTGQDIESANKYLSEVEDVVISFCKRYFQVREFIKDKVYEIVQDELNEELQNELPDELDAISSHTIFKYAMVEDVQGINISSTGMSIKGSGYVEIELNYGHGEDGFSADDSYPFEFEAEIYPSTLKVGEIRATVDTSSFYE